MPIRVLHIFTPNYKHRFGGPIFRWKYAFSHWDHPEIEHFTIDYDQRQILNANEAFSFKISSSQESISRKKRIIWIFNLLRYLHQNKDKYDLIHFHVLWWGTLVAGIWATKNKIPVIYESVLLGSDTPNRINQERWGKIKVRILKENFNIVSISESLTEEYRLAGFEEDRLFTLMNSVDFNTFHPISSEKEKNNLRQKYGLPQNAKILIFVGSLIARKGFDLLITSFVELSKSQEDLFLLVVGPRNSLENPSVNDEFVVNLRKQVEKNQITSQTLFLGLIQDRKQLAELYQASNLFIFPSRNEGFPNVVLEAMACGLPVIVSKLPGIEKVINNNETGVILQNNDAESISLAVQRLIGEPKYNAIIGSRASNFIQQNHSFTAWQNQLSNVYVKVIAGS